MVRCIITGLERGEGFVQLWNFLNFLVKPAPYARQPKNKAAKTPLRRICRFLIAKVLRVEEISEKTNLDTTGGGGGRT
jgi:hypothetical protein